MTVIPDSIEPVEQWRTWNFDGRRLLSHNGAEWKPGEPHTAKCRDGYSDNYEWRLERRGMSCEEAAQVAHNHNMSAMYSTFGRTRYQQYLSAPKVTPPDGYGYVLGTAAHDSPDENCTCGIYAGIAPADCPSGSILGKVKLWGKIVPGEKGCRAEFAYPSELHVTKDLLDAAPLLAYGVPLVEVAQKTTDMQAVISALVTTNRGPRMLRWQIAAIAANFAACALNFGIIGWRFLA